MESLASVVDAVADGLAGVVAFDGLAGLADESLLGVAAAIERLGRRVDGLRVAAAGELAERSRGGLGREGLAARKGCRNAAALLERVALVSGESALKRIKVGAVTRARCSLSGEWMPAVFPVVAGALGAGELGFDSSRAIVRGLSVVSPRVDSGAVRAAETELVAAATGVGPDTPIACAADDIRMQVLVWQQRLDQDGAEPAAERAMRLRGFRLGRERDGVVPVSGGLLPEVAAKFTAVFDACMSPRTAPAFLGAEELAAAELDHDPRTRDQQRHDILAGAIDIAARSGEVPTMGGASPTVLVSVRQQDLENSRGVGFIGQTPIPMSAVRQFACTGGTQRVVFDGEGRIIQLGSPQRCFTPQQRRAITLRDGGCVTPGCHVPASWCEIHHVDPAENHGPTHTDNGVLLCWFHHRTLESSGWEYRMRHGVPEVKAPPWLDHTRRWHPTTRSHTVQLDSRRR